MLDVTENVEFIGFTLPNTSVTSRISPIGSDVIFTLFINPGFLVCCMPPHCLVVSLRQQCKDN